MKEDEAAWHQLVGAFEFGQRSRIGAILGEIEAVLESLLGLGMFLGGGFGGNRPACGRQHGNGK